MDPSISHHANARPGSNAGGPPEEALKQSFHFIFVTLLGRM